MNTRPCLRCNTPHWQDGRLCFECRMDEEAPTRQRLLDAFTEAMAKAKGEERQMKTSEVRSGNWRAT